MTNIANWKIPKINGGFNGKIIYFYGPHSMAMLNNQRAKEKWSIPQKLNDYKLIPQPGYRRKGTCVFLNKNSLANLTISDG
jgi:hypothetical protein